MRKAVMREAAMRKAVGCILAPLRGGRPDSSTRFLGHKKWSGGNSDSLLETHGHNRRTLVTQPKIFKTPRGILALRIRNINARIVAVAVGFEMKEFALMQVKKRRRAARIGALRKHSRRSLGGGKLLDK